MIVRGFALLAALSFPLFAHADESTAKFEIEVSPAAAAADAESGRTPEKDAEWFRRVLARGVGIPKEEIQTEVAGPGQISLSVPKSLGPLTGKVLEHFASNPRLNFHPVHPGSSELAADVAEGKNWHPGYKALPFAEDYALVTLLAAVSGDTVQSAEAKSGTDGNWSISVKFDPTGAAAMQKTTTENNGRQLAIVLGERVISAPVIRQPFSTGCVISGNFSESEAVSLAAFIGDPPPFTFKVKPAP